MAALEGQTMAGLLLAALAGAAAGCITGLLQTKLGHKYPVGRILESLRKYNCTKIDTNIYQFLYFDEITQSCGEAFHKELNNKYRTQQQIRRLLRY